MISPDHCGCVSARADGRRHGHAIIPIENTIDGSVGLHTDWFVDEVDLPIQAEWVYPSIQNLIGPRRELFDDNGELAYDRIIKVLSHPAIRHGAVYI